MYVLPNLTSELQPNDLCVNKIFKQNYQAYWEDYMLKIVCRNPTSSKFDPIEKSVF